MGTPKRQPRALTDEEEAEIQKLIAADPDDSDITDEEMVQAKPFAEALPELMESIRRARGRPKIEKPLQQISLRLDPDVIAKFKATGKGWQARINDALRNAKVG